MEHWEYCALEWVWDRSEVRLYLTEGQTSTFPGSYTEIVSTLNTLGASGWEVAGCVATANWMYWTLKRRA